MNTPFDITKEEVLNLAAQKLMESVAGENELWEKAESLIEKQVSALVSKGLAQKVDEVLNKEMTELLSKEIIPVDIWGDKCGTPTTIRAELHKRAKEFWDVKVDDNGKESNWGGEPRHHHLMKSILKDEFSKAVKDNTTEVVKAFKAALKEGTTSITNQHIDNLIHIR